MPVSPQKILTLLEKRFPGATIRLSNRRGDQDHYDLYIESDHFNGQSRVRQHQMVYEALKDLLVRDLHALSLKTAPGTK